MNCDHAQISLALCIIVAISLVANLVRGQPPQDNKRARHPDWRNLPSGIFFEDAFRDGLTGPRPKVRGGANSSNSAAHDVNSAPTPQSSGFAWSQLISAATIEDEIKAVKRRVEESVATAGYFKSRGYLQARREFSIAAALFAIIAEYDDEVRWKTSAPMARDSMARVAANAKVGTTPVYREAKQGLLDLEQLIRGSRLAGEPGRADVDWGELLDRGPLMLRLERAQKERLAVWLASKPDFNTQRQRIVHEAELVAMLAQIFATEGMPDADDDEYKAYCQMLKEAAQGVIDAVHRNDYGAARRSAGEILKNCSDCHELYRA